METLIVNKICYVIGAGENYGLDFSPAACDFVVAADAGIIYLKETGIRTDLIIGDFDTLKFIPEHPNVAVLNAEKNDTDMFAAVKIGIEKGYKNFHIYCGTGGRIDHTFANVQTLAYLSENGMRGFLFDKDSIITSITDDKLCFEKIPCGYVSVFSYSPKSEGVNLSGLKYELDNATLTNTFPLGTSNEFIGQKSVISVEAGTLVIVFPRSAMKEII